MRVYYDLLILIFTEINCYCCYCYCYKKLLNVCTDEAKRQQFCSHNGVLAALIMYSERSRENGEAVARREVINVRYRFIACDRPLGQSTVALPTRRPMRSYRDAEYIIQQRPNRAGQFGCENCIILTTMWSPYHSLPTPTMSVGIGRIFESVCFCLSVCFLFVCLFVCPWHNS